MNFDLIGPAVGSEFPDLVLPDQNGELVDIASREAGRGAIVVFYRSADW